LPVLLISPKVDGFAIQRLRWYARGVGAHYKSKQISHSSPTSIDSRTAHSDLFGSLLHRGAKLEFECASCHQAGDDVWVGSHPSRVYRGLPPPTLYCVISRAPRDCAARSGLRRRLRSGSVKESFISAQIHS
jgi:hypothetical protein